MVVIGGVIPAQDYDFLREHGASAIFGPGTVIPVCAKKVMEELNIKVFRQKAAGSGMEKSVKPKGAEYTTHRPEWVPDGAEREFATRVMDGVDDAHDGMTSLPPPPLRIAFPRRRKLSTEDYIKGVLDGNRTE